jgi:hypothetical protein
MTHGDMCDLAASRPSSTSERGDAWTVFLFETVLRFLLIVAARGQDKCDALLVC